MSQHICNTCKVAYIQIRHISSIRHFLTTQATKTLVCSLVLSRLHYCNSLISGCPQYLLDKLQKVQNAAPRLACKAKKSDHIHPILENLHWLPVTHRIRYKISTICFNAISGTAPQYLSDLLQPYTPARQLRSASDTWTSCKHKSIWWKIFFLMLAHLSGTICLKQSATLILPPLSKPPSRRTCLIIISKLFFHSPDHPLVRHLCVCVCGVSVIVKRHVLPPSVVDGRSRNPLLLL